MSVMHTIGDIIKRHFFSGVLVVVPLILTYLVLRLLFETVDGILQPLLYRLFGYYIPGLGVITSLLVIVLVGFFTRSLIGAAIYRLGEKILTKLPLVRPIYSSAKQLIEATTSTSTEAFKAVVLVEYPRRGVHQIGFLAKRFELDTGERTAPFVSIFIPSTPTPVSGMVVIVPEDEVIRLDMTIEDGVKFLVSGGVASPDLIKRKAPMIAG